MSTQWSTKVVGKGGGVNFGDLLKEDYAVILLQGKNVFGDLVYCYIDVTIPNLEKLQALLKTDANFNASDFGKVIAAGRGTPTAEVRAEIGNTYKFEQQAAPKPAVPTGEIPAEKKSWDDY